MRPTATADAVARAGRWAALALAACLCIGAAAADLAPGGPERLALVEETTGGQDVLVIDVSRGTVMRLARGRTEIDRLVWSPAGRMVVAFALAPDGRSVAYARGGQILVADLEGNGRRTLVQGGWGPAWSRDGRRVAFLTEAGSDPAARRYHVETIEPDGRNRRRVTQRSGNYWGLAWAPVPAGQP